MNTAEINTILFNATLQAPAILMPPDYRLMIIEDIPGLRLSHTHWNPLYTKKGYTIDTSKSVIELLS